MKILSLPLLLLTAILPCSVAADSGTKTQVVTAAPPSSHESSTVESEAPTIEPFKVGLLVSSSGPEKERGEAMRNGATLATELINRRGGVFKVPLKLVVEESAPESRGVIKAFSTLVADGTVLAVVSAGEDDGGVIKGFAEQAQIPLLVNSTRTDILRGVEFTIRIGRSIAAAQDTLFTLATQRKISQLALLVGDQTWATSAVAQMMTSHSDHNLRVSSSMRFWSLDGKVDPKTMNSLKNSSDDFIYLVASGDEREQILESLTTAKITPRAITLFSCDGEVPSLRLKKYPALSYSLDVATDKRSAQFKEMKEAFDDRFPRLKISFDFLVGYDAVMLIADALKAGAGTGGDIRDHLLSVKTFSGAAGKIEFTPERDSIRPVEMNAVIDGVCKNVAEEVSASTPTANPTQPM